MALGIILALIRANPFEIWRTEGWFFGLLLALTYAGCALGMLEMYFRQTWFTNLGIRQRSMFGITKFVSYTDVSEITVYRNKSLVIEGQGSERLRVHAMEGDPEEILEILGRFVEPNTPVVTV